MVKNPPANSRDIREASLIPESGRSPGREMATCSSTLAGESHGQRSLVGYSPWGHKQSGMTDVAAHSIAAAIIYLSQSLNFIYSA